MLRLTIQHCEYKDVKPERIALKNEYYFWTLVKGTADKKPMQNVNRNTIVKSDCTEKEFSW